MSAAEYGCMKCGGETRSFGSLDAPVHNIAQCLDCGAQFEFEPLPLNLLPFPSSAKYIGSGWETKSP